MYQVKHTQDYCFLINPAFWGLAGGFFKEFIHHKLKKVNPAKWEADNGNKGIDLGLWAGTVVGAIGGVGFSLPLIDKVQSFFTLCGYAFIFGICSPIMLEMAIKFGYKIFPMFRDK